MSNDLFRISQQRGIYHTLSLWSMLSPHLVKKEKGEKDSRAETGTSTGNTDVGTSSNPPAGTKLP